MRELDELRDKIRKRFKAGEVTQEAFIEGMRLIENVEAYLVDDERTQNY